MKKRNIKIPEKVIVDLVLFDMDFQRDAEIPTQMLIGDVRKGLLVLLREREPKKFSKVTDIALSFRGNKLADETTLAEVGAWDGSTIELERITTVPVGKKIWLSGG